MHKGCPKDREKDPVNSSKLEKHWEIGNKNQANPKLLNC